MSIPRHSRSPLRKKLGIVCITFLFGILTLHLVSERSADRDWGAYKMEAAARGEPVEWALHVPIAPPDSQNFYGVPVAQKWMPVKGGTSGAVGPTLKRVNASPGGPVNLVELKPSEESRRGSPRHPAGFRFTAPATMADLKSLPRGQKDGDMTLESLHTWVEQWNAEFEHFRAAGERHHVYLAGDYSSAPTLPIQNFVAARTLAQLLATKANVNLLLGNSEMAGKDLESIATVIRGMETKPSTLVAAMIRIAIAGLYQNVVKEGLAENLWKPAEIKQIRDYTSSFDALGAVQDSILNGERVGITQVLEMATSIQGGIELAKLLESGERSRVREIIGALYPRGWIRRNQLYIARILDETAATLDVKSRQFYPERARAVQARIAAETKTFNPNRMFASIAIPNFSKAFETSARIQSQIDMTTIACGLALFKMEKGSFPAELSELVPNYVSILPRDVVTGRAITYKRTEPVKFMLYAVGADGKDDGGDPKTDWVWGV